MSRVLIILAILSLPRLGRADTSSPLAPEETKQVLKKMHQTLANVRSLKLPLTQTRSLKAFSDELKTEGVLYFLSPDKVRWETTKPFRSAIIYNDRKAAKFEWTNFEWRKLNFPASDLMAEIMGNMMAWMRGDFSQTEHLYHLKLFPGYRIQLIPKSATFGKNLRSIDIQIDKKTFQATTVTLNEAEGDYVKISFSTPKENLDLGGPLFDLNNPT